MGVEHEQTALGQFLSGYFHQDWDLDAGEPTEVVADFVAAVGPAEACRVADQIDAVLASEPPEDALWNDLLGCGPSPDSCGIQGPGRSRSSSAGVRMVSRRRLRVLGSAMREGLPVLTADTRFTRFMRAVGHPVEGF